MSARIPRDPVFTLTELRYAVTVAELRHFGRAAAACSVSQPTLSAGVRRLEEALGLQLFERTSKRVAVTERGAELLARAQSIFEEVVELEDQAFGGSTPLAGRLRVGIIPTLSPYLLPWLVPPLVRAHPALELIVHEDMTHQVLAQLREHRLDATLLALPIDAAGLVVRPLFDEPFVVLAPREHPLAKRKRVRQESLLEHEVLLLTEGHCLRDQALEVCRGAEARRDAAEGDFRATSLETIRQMVIAGMGITLMPSMAITSEDRRRAATRVLALAAPVPSRRIALAYRRGTPRAKGLDELAEFVREHVPESVKRVRASDA
jgi:LysR family hydrogen peroxide-inducible transcriptional activator